MTAINTSTLPVSDLRIDEKSNVRKHGRGADPQMTASIKAIGLQQPLLVRPNGKGHVVIDGGKRFEAIQELVKTGDLPKDFAVPVIIGNSDDAKARETSLALNVIRTNMHPVDEFRAFHQLHVDKSNPQTPEQIAARFGISTKGVVQRLALGALDDSVLNAWLAGHIDARDAKLFTMQSSKKVQKAALEKSLSNGGFNSYGLREALGLSREARAGKLLTLVTEDAYVARGGKINRDLFAEGGNDNTIISDGALLQAMAQELLDNECKRLTAEGWGTVTQEVPESLWNYPRIDVTAKPTKEEAARLKQIEKKLQELEEADEGNDELDAEEQSIKQKIEERALASIEAKVKAKGIAFVGLSHDDSRIEITFRNPPEKEKALNLKGGEKGKGKKIAPEDAISQALLTRQAEWLTAAAQAAIVHQPHVAMAALIASITSGDDAVHIHAAGVRPWNGKVPSFASTMEAALKMTTAKQIETLTALVAKNLSLINRNSKDPALKDADYRALALAIDGKKMTAATREKWDAKDFFNSVSRSTIVEAVREAMGDDHAGKVAKMGKADAVKFAIVNVGKGKWLPKQLRVTGYDGPAKKIAKKATAKKAKK